MQSVGVTDTSLETLDGNVSVTLLQDTEFDSLFDTEVQSSFNIFSPVRDRFLLVNEWENTSVQVRESSSSGVSGDQDDWAVWSVLGNQSSGGTRGRQNDDSLSLLFEDSSDGGSSNSFSGRSWLWSAVSDVIVVWQVSNSLFSDQSSFSHSGNSVNWVVTLSGFTGQHDTVSTVQNSVTDIGNFSSGWSWVVGHRFQHLGSTDNWLTGQVRLSDQLLLDSQDFWGWDFDTQVTSGNHDSVSDLQDFVEVVNTLLVFNLDDDLDVLTVFTQNFSDGQNILSGSDERSEDHVDTVFNTESQVSLVLFRQSWQVDIGTWQVNTLVGADLTSVQGLDLQGLVVNDLQDFERQNTVIDVDDSTSGDDLGDVLVVQVHDLVVTSLSVLVIGGEDHFVVWWDWVVNFVSGGTSSDFWTLGVQSNSQWSTWV